jgi:hypothetical protein
MGRERNGRSQREINEGYRTTRRKGTGRGGTKAKREKNRGTAVNKYAGMGEGDKEKAKDDEFNEELIQTGGGCWIYGKVRFANIELGEEGYTKDELKFLYPRVRDVSDFCRIKKAERFYLFSGDINRHYVHVEIKGIVGAVMENGNRVNDMGRLDDLIPEVLQYDSRRDAL